MTIFTAMWLFIVACAKAFFKVLTWWVNTVDWRITVGLIAVVLFFAWGVSKGYDWAGGQGGLGCSCRSCRQLVCGRTPRPPRPERTHQERGTVASVEAANRFTIEQGDRRKRTREVTIRYIVTDGSQASTDYAATLLPVGSAVVVEALGGRFGDADPQSGLPQQDGSEELEATTGETTGRPGTELLGREMTDAEFEALKVDLEGRGTLVGVVTAANGANVGLSLIEQGLATCADGSPPAYIAAEKAAKKRK